jgi:UDP-N-acetylmuramoyl-tripeptide--D-alanyl-D-alanine ligase
MAGRLEGTDRAYRGVSTDSRRIRDDQLYIALCGENFDGHDFVVDALGRGAAGCVVETHQPVQGPQVVVSNTRLALGDLARSWRKRFNVPVLGVTGSNGKTTVKEMMASIMGQNMPVLATRGNLNNDIGVPLTLFEMGREHRAAVIEMGANHAGEIKYLAGLARPTVAVVTNAGPAHLEGFGSLNGVARAKGELFESLGLEGTAIINADDPFAPLWRELAAPRKVLSFGLADGADVRAADIEADEAFGQRFMLLTPAGARAVNLRLLGRHNVSNALAAAAACLAAGASLELIVQGLGQVGGVAGRLQFSRAVQGASICDDTYNANPLSLRAALETLRDMGGENWLVLGDMGELGEKGPELHRQAGRDARELGATRLFALGELTSLSVEAFGEGASHYPDADALVAALKKALRPGVRVLVKGSRAMRMERVVQALVETAGQTLETGS